MPIFPKTGNVLPIKLLTDFGVSFRSFKAMPINAHANIAKKLGRNILFHELALFWYLDVF